MGYHSAFPKAHLLDEAVSDALSNQAQYGAWPKELRAAFDRNQQQSLFEDLRFHMMIGLVVVISSIVLDALALPERLPLAVTWRMLGVVPFALVGLFALKPHQMGAMKLMALLPLFSFTALAVHLASMAPPEVAVRYLMAITMMMGVSVLILPFAPREAGQFALTFALISILSGIWPNALEPDMLLQHIVLVAMVGVPCWLMGRRLWQVKARGFLLDLQDETRAAALEASNARLRALSERDPLTGLANRRHFENEFHAHYQAINPELGRTALLLIDLDRFKNFNDSYGHLAGDQYLRRMASELNRVAQAESGLAARFGGEEFIAVLREQRPGAAQRVAENFRQALTGLECDLECEIAEPLTASIGIAHSSAIEAESLHRLIERADAALYQAKREGRHRAVFADIVAA